MAGECLGEAGGLQEEGVPRELPSLLTASSLSSHCLSLQQEQWMNVCVGDIIKLENNQFVAVREVALQGNKSLPLFLADRNESFLVSYSLVMTHGLNFVKWGASFLFF